MQELSLSIPIQLETDANGSISFSDKKSFKLSEIRNYLIGQYPFIKFTDEHSFEISKNQLMINFYKEV